jgi:hypothetical protein
MFEQQYFGDFVVQQLPYLKRLVCKLTRGDQIADDIVQQTMLKALIHAHQFRFQPSLKTWLSGQRGSSSIPVEVAKICCSNADGNGGHTASAVSIPARS